MHDIYLWCLILGLAILLLSIIGTGLTDVFQGGFDFNLDTSFTSDILSGLLPLSPLELCAFIIGFGGIGLTFLDKVTYHLFIALCAGFLMSLGTKALLRALKKVDSSTLTDQELLGMEGIVVVTIFENGVGSVSFNTNAGKITYSARSDKTIPQGNKIKVVSIEKHTVIVCEI